MVHKVLLVGESWVTAETHFKGFDQFGSVRFVSGAKPLKEALAGSDFELHYMTAHDAAEDFPYEIEALREYDVVLLSDIGANTFLLPSAVWVHSETRPNRLRLIKQWVEEGGHLMMIGGYLSFQGIDGRAKWRKTAVEDVLPVTCFPWDDRIEIPEGATAELVQADHPCLANLQESWPPVLGVNEVEVREGAEVLAKLSDEQGGHPLLVVGHYGKGRTAVWTSDMSPHWLSPSFCAWEGYRTLWQNILGWLVD